MSISHSYSPISQYYLNIFGEKVWKIPLSVADDCPNRRGLNGMEICSFCDVWGSAAYPEYRDQSFASQVRTIQERLRARYHANSFLAYFQAYTTTFMALDRLKKYVQSAIEVPDVRGFILGTRPDCLSDGLLTWLQDENTKRYVSVEFGVQSFFDHHLDFLRRGHSAEKSRQAIHIVRDKTNIDIGVHLIFGLPGETDTEIIATARMLNDLPIQNVKLHNLHVLKNTTLEKWYLEKKFEPISLTEYARRVILFLQHLRSDIYVQRLGALSSRWDELIAPDWTKHKMRTHQYILDQMHTNGVKQGMTL